MQWSAARNKNQRQCRPAIREEVRDFKLNILRHLCIAVAILCALRICLVSTLPASCPVQRYPSAVLGKDPSYNENHALNVYVFYLEITRSNNLEYQTATESP